MSLSEKKLTRKEAKAQSRKRLIDATIGVLCEEGPAGLTTGKIARAAGLSQPSFYVHFKDMDEALLAAADEIGCELRSALFERRRQAVSERSHETLHAAFVATLNAFTDNPTFAQIVLRYRFDHTGLFGERIRGLFKAIREDLLSDCRNRGLDESRLPDLHMFVDLMLGMILSVVEGLLEGRYADRNECAEVLFRATISVYSALQSRASGARPQS